MFVAVAAAVLRALLLLLRPGHGRNFTQNSLPDRDSEREDPKNTPCDWVKR